MSVVIEEVTARVVTPKEPEAPAQTSSAGAQEQRIDASRLLEKAMRLRVERAARHRAD
jgi:hypothetical protein